MALVIFPQYPAKMRYQEWWFKELPKRLGEHFDDVLMISGQLSREEYSGSSFSPLKASVLWEAGQIKDAINIINPDDILFFCDVSYPGFVPQLVYHFKDNKKFGFCHATALNFGDIFRSVALDKYRQEYSAMNQMTGIFYGTQYSMHKHGGDLKNGYVVGLPMMPYDVSGISRIPIHDVGIATRMDPQKVDQDLLKVLMDSDLDISFHDHTTSDLWHDYFSWIASCRVILSIAREETYGYVSQDASKLNVPFIAPNKFGYQEVVKRGLRYNDSSEMMELISVYRDAEFDSLTTWARESSELWFRNVSRIIHEQD